VAKRTRCSIGKKKARTDLTVPGMTKRAVNRIRSSTEIETAKERGEISRPSLFYPEGSDTNLR
jgi:hypothetical protein